MHSLPFLFAVFIYLFIFIPRVLAKVEVINPPAKIEMSKEFTVDVALSNLTDPTHFLSIALHKNSGDPYFGQTQNGNNWIEADDNNCKSFPQATVSEGSWSGKLKGKIIYGEKDFDNSLGNYILKIFKYTDSCNKSSSNDVPVEIFDPNPPPTAVPTNIPTPIPTSPPSNTPVPSATPKPQNTVPVYLSPTAVKTAATKAPSVTRGLVLGEISEQSVTPTAEKKPEISADKNQFPVFPVLFGGGILFIAGAIALSVKQIRNRRHL